MPASNPGSGREGGRKAEAGMGRSVGGLGKQETRSHQKTGMGHEVRAIPGIDLLVATSDRGYQSLSLSSLAVLARASNQHPSRRGYWNTGGFSKHQPSVWESGR